MSRHEQNRKLVLDSTNRARRITRLLQRLDIDSKDYPGSFGNLRTETLDAVDADLERCAARLEGLVERTG